MAFPHSLIGPRRIRRANYVNLEVSNEELTDISETGLLALNLEEMQAIQEHYRNPAVRRPEKA